MKYNIPRIIIAATSSGSGKTTLTLGLIRALKDKINLSTFKCGPDYIDPMFHKEVLGRNSYNLDSFLMGEDNLKHSLYKNSLGSEMAIIEGVMGYYDGISGKGDLHSTYHISKITRTPTILVINGKGAAYTIIAHLKGLIDFRKDSNIVGVIFNNITEGTYKYLEKMVISELGIVPLGYMEHLPESCIESRHLGLVTATEISQLYEKIGNLSRSFEKTIRLDEIIKISSFAEEIEVNPIKIEKKYKDLHIAVAFDKAFCFYYQDNLNLLEEMGAKLSYFSPLSDKSLPENINGMIIGGGYPELHLELLQENKNLLSEIKKHLARGLPCHAECGGFMYLGEQIQDNLGNYMNTVGFFQGKSHKGQRLKRFGYYTLTANKSNLLADVGQTINAHEFHYWDSDFCGDFFMANKPFADKKHQCMIQNQSVIGGYPHLHYYGNVSFIQNFLDICEGFKNGRII